MILRYAVPILAFCIASVQFYNVQDGLISRWKGGGFGMYTEAHPQRRPILINGIFYKNILKENKSKISDELDLEIQSLRENASSEKLFSIAKQLDAINILPEKKLLIIQVWKPVFNIKKQSASRELINEIEYVR